MQELEDIFNREDYYFVYEILNRYLKINDFKEKRKKQNELFIKYLKFKFPKNIDNLYEKMIVRFSTMKYTDEILAYLLSLDLDFEYKSKDIFDTPFLLKYFLASNIKSKEIMKLYLNKITIDRIYFGNSRYRAYTDIVRMNIIAGNLREALEIFNNPNYHLINIDYTSDTKIIEFFSNRENIYIDSLGLPGFIENDMLYQIVLTIKESNLDIESKKIFLKSFLYNNKIKLFNINILPIIKEILDYQDNDFLDYLKTKINNKEIYLYDTINRNTIYLTNLEGEKVKRY